VKPEILVRDAIDPAHRFLSTLTGRALDTPEARLFSLAISFQETDVDDRIQVGDGGKLLPKYARSFWQFERMGGVAELIEHPKAGPLLKAICERLDIPCEVNLLHEAMAWNDFLAACMARLLFWIDPDPVPGLTDVDKAYQVYDRRWRPGNKRPEDWPKSHAKAAKVIAALQSTPEPVQSTLLPATTTPEQPAVTHLTEDRIDAIVRAAMRAQEAEPAAPPAPAAPATPPGQLTVERGPDGQLAVDLPTMNRSWKTGEWWIGLISIVGPMLVALSPIIEPAFETLASNPAFVTSPIAGVLIFIARSLYKGWRVSVAASVAKAEVKA
jgi:hypothetical protein